MQFINTIAASLLLVGSALAQSSGSVTVHVVQVSSSEQNTLKFSPNNVQAQPGEMVQFQFRNGNHTVTQSTFAKPCIPINNVMSNVTGFFSGFQPSPPGSSSIPTYTIMVNDTKPIWYYCSQGKHCQAGMVGAINAATSGNKTIDAFTSLAAQATENLAPGEQGSGAAASSSSSSTSMSYGSGGYSYTSTSAAVATPSSTETGSSGSTTTSSPPTVSTGAAAGSNFASSQQVFTGFSLAALLSALLL